MGEGLTLTAASNVCFVEFGWNQKQHSQAEDRCHRIGQHDTVNIWHLTAVDTIEEEIVALIERKRQIAEAIQDGDEDSQREFLAELERILEERLARGRGETPATPQPVRPAHDESWEAEQADRFDRKFGT
jgi:SNF2 family DNA or RNA helicase